MYNKPSVAFFPPDCLSVCLFVCLFVYVPSFYPDYGRTMYFCKCSGIAPKRFFCSNHFLENKRSAYL